MADCYSSTQPEGGREEGRVIEPVTAVTIDQLSGLTEKIGEQKYREVYRCDEFAIKKIKRQITRRILFIKIRIPAPIYFLLRFAIRDLNEFEYHQFQSLILKTPADLCQYYAKVYKPIKAMNTCYSINQLAIDDDGKVCKTLREYGKVSDEQFWSAIDKLENLFCDKRIYYFGVGCANICVCRHADGQLVPILIDYKRIGIRTFWHQPLLFLPFFKELKMRRRFARLRKRYKSC